MITYWLHELTKASLTVVWQGSAAWVIHSRRESALPFTHILYWIKTSHCCPAARLHFWFSNYKKCDHHHSGNIKFLQNFSVQTIWHKNIVCGCRVVLIQECSRGNESHHHLNNCHIHISVRLRDPVLCLYFLILLRSGHFWASDIGQCVSSNQQIIANRVWGQDSC